MAKSKSNRKLNFLPDRQKFTPRLWTGFPSRRRDTLNPGEMSRYYFHWHSEAIEVLRRYPIDIAAPLRSATEKAAQFFATSTSEIERTSSDNIIELAKNVAPELQFSASFIRDELVFARENHPKMARLPPVTEIYSYEMLDHVFGPRDESQLVEEQLDAYREHLTDHAEVSDTTEIQANAVEVLICIWRLRRLLHECSLLDVEENISEGIALEAIQLVLCATRMDFKPEYEPKILKAIKFDHGRNNRKINSLKSIVKMIIRECGVSTPTRTIRKKLETDFNAGDFRDVIVTIDKDSICWHNLGKSHQRTLNSARCFANLVSQVKRDFWQ